MCRENSHLHYISTTLFHKHIVVEMYSFFYFPFVEGSICKATLYILSFWPME
jgi:hypothetical protein